MMTWYYNLNARERLIVIGGAIALAVMIAYAAVWVPLSTKVELLRTSVDGQVNTLEWMHQASQEVRALKASGPATQRTTANRSLLAVVDQSAASAGLKSALQRMDPDGSHIRGTTSTRSETRRSPPTSTGSLAATEATMP